MKVPMAEAACGRTRRFFLEVSPADVPQRSLTDAGQEPLNAPFLNELFSSRFSRGKTAPQEEIGEMPH